MKHFYILIFFVINILSTTANAQWVKLNQDSVQYYAAVHFLNADTGFIAGRELINPYDGIILRTLDGGNTWDTISIGWVFPTDIQFINDSVGFIGGQDGAFYKTTDLGSTWNEIGYCIWLDDISNFHFFNESSGVCLNFYGSIRLIDPNLSPLICISNFNSSATTYFPGTGELGFLNNLEGYAAGGNGKFLKTFDGGNNWNFFNCDSSIYILSANMSDQNHAVVVGKNGKYSVTNDGGLNWAFPVSMSHHHLMDVDFYNNQYGYAVGGFSSPSNWPSSGNYPIGSIWSTTDGGNSWSLVDSSYSDQLIDIHIVNDSLAFAVGLSGLVLKNTSHFSTINNIQENNNNINFSTFPNPFSEEINISLATTISENHITLFDLSGKLIFTKQFIGSNFRINTSHLSKGVYFIKIISDNGVATNKLVKVE